MKLDKVRAARSDGFFRSAWRLTLKMQDNSGTIEREEFLSLPQISSNPLATRFVSMLGVLLPGPLQD